MQFQRRFKAAIREGDVTCSFRKWQRPQVKIGGRYNIHGYGAIEVNAIQPVKAGRARLKDIKRSGFDTRAELLNMLNAESNDTLYLIELRYLGSAPVKQPDRQALSKPELHELIAKLQNMDIRSKKGPWATATIKLIGQHPARRAPDLAAILSWDTQPFKANVRKLKAMGLTESMETGYRLTVRGMQVLDAL